ncbi:MAG TPA: PIN domain-containing protein [Thermoanaerobaculia bacterium]|nr:PIN domain-containing protein [Thermoanaerobaculia bacterium]
MIGLLDTAIVVDILRDHPPAVSWLQAQQEPLGLSPVVWLEVIEGAANKIDQKRAVQLLGRFERVEVAPTDFDWAIRGALALRLSHNIDMMDCLIAASAHRLGLPLFTRNFKHFQPLIGPLALKPY